MMDKILAITRKDLYQTFTDRNLLILMIAAPLAISTIVGLVFGGLGGDGGGLPISNIPVAIVNLDEGTEQQGQQVNYGATLTSIFIPGAESDGNLANADCPLVAESDTQGGPSSISLETLIAAEQLDSVDAGRLAVEHGDYAVLIVIPADFSTRLSTSPAFGGEVEAVAPTSVEVLANSGQGIEGTIVRSIVEGMTNQFLTGNIAIAASFDAMIPERPLATLALLSRQNAPAVGAILGCGFSGQLATINIDPQSLAATEEAETPPSDNLTTLILIQTGSAQAVFFALFSGQAGVISIINERRSGTLQRMLISPTPRNIILLGKLFATFVMVVVQLLILFLALSLIASIVAGQLSFIWGSNLIAVFAVMLALGLCVAGLGVLLISFVKTPEQLGPIGTVINIGMAVTGGAFGFPPIIPLAYLSLIYWGTDAFTKLAAGNNDILLNMVVLALEGVLLFGIGTALFSRRVEVI